MTHKPQEVVIGSAAMLHMPLKGLCWYVMWRSTGNQNHVSDRSDWSHSGSQKPNKAAQIGGSTLQRAAPPVNENTAVIYFQCMSHFICSNIYFSRSTHKNSMILFDSRSLDTEALFKGHMRTARLSVCLEFSSLVGGWCHLLKIESGWRAFKDQQHPECRSPVFHQKTDHVISCNSGTAAGLVLANELNDRLRVSQVGGNKPELNAVNVILTLILRYWNWCCSDCKAVWFYVRTL